MRRRIRPFQIALLALVVAASSCSKSSTTAENTDHSTPATNTATGTVSVTVVDLGRAIGGDQRVTESVEVFKPTDTIYASVLTTGTAPAAALKARWTFEDGQVVDETEQSIAPTGEAATEFHISKPDGFPAGKYKVEILLNGASVQSKDFEVRA